MSKQRTAQVKINDKWVDIEFSKLKKNNIFRLFESDGKEAIDEKGRKVWKAFSDAYFKDGNWIIDIYN